MNTNRGFTLIELMIVLMIIAVIATLGIPNLMRARMTSNEGSAVAGMRTISSAQQQFQTASIIIFPSGMGQYAPDLATLGSQVPSFLDSSLALGNKQGYLFTTFGGGVDGGPTFTANCTPLSLGFSGSRAFYVDHSGLITYAVGAGPAGPGNDPVQ